MKTKRAVVLGAVFGLMIGLVMFLVALSLRDHEGSVLMTPYKTLNMPALWVLVRLRGLFYDWQSFAGLSQVLVGFLIYWGLLGILAGLGLRVFWNRKHQVRDA
jgi:hypothetical protein